MRMHMRRFTRLTNGFSKKVENHAYAVALHMMYYNFVRIHSKLRMSPAMSAGVSDRLWEIGDIVKLVEDAEPEPESAVLIRNGWLRNVAISEASELTENLRASTNLALTPKRT